MIFDTHAHYDDKQFESDREKLLSAMGKKEKNKVAYIVDVGASIESSKQALALARDWDYVYAAIGVHPSEVGCLEEGAETGTEAGARTGADAIANARASAEAGADARASAKLGAEAGARIGADAIANTGASARTDARSNAEADARISTEADGMEWLRQHLSAEKVVAVGEIGLDYHWGKDSEAQERQRFWFCRQLELAREAGLPVIIHSREAAADTLEIMKEHAKGIPGVIHCFSYTVELAREYVKMGYYIGVGGVVTFKNAKKLKEAVAEIPLGNLVVETDCPYLAPEPHRGERNMSPYLPLVIDEIARIKGVSPEEVEDATYRNAISLYGLRAG